jgi:hypothetical protein
VCREDRRDHCRGLRGRARIHQSLCECGMIRPRIRTLIWRGFSTRCDPIRTH